jgi:glycyl-tRNA synthetase beta chain
MADTRDLLFELGCEELPPTTLKTLRDHLLQGVCSGLKEANLTFGTTHCYATPRRLAIWIEGVALQQQDCLVEKRGPAVAAAYDADGNPSKAALGFARGCGAAFDELETLKTDKGEWLSYKKLEKGLTTKAFIASIIDQALSRLPIAKRMRWGSSNDAFVRPVHWAVLLFGNDTIEHSFFGCGSSNITYGHRFHAPAAITIKSAADYTQQLRNNYVIADFEERKSTIQQQAVDAASAVNGYAHIEPSLLDEITALVEYPVAVTGGFDAHFLALPKEVLITTMQTNQKYFPVLNAHGDLLPHFITISNIQSSNPSAVSHGNERVIRPRLSDAEFFWQQDMKCSLADRVAILDNVVFQHKLGSVGEKTRRVEKLSGSLAKQLDFDANLASRAATLCKTDLVTDMVGEFASLQGVIGRYYALENSEPAEVAEAIQEHYLPKQSGDALPQTHTGQVVALADKLDTLAAIFSIGLIPTGDKDPFALRRASLGILRIIIECNLDLDLKSLINATLSNFSHTFDTKDVENKVLSFILERLKGYCLSNGFSVEQFSAVSSVNCTQPVDFMARVHAVKDFAQLDEAASLAEANKRIQNLLKKAPDNIDEEFNAALLVDAAEKSLHQQLQAVKKTVTPLINNGQYVEALKCLSTLKTPIDAFFEDVFIMAEDESLKNTRLALLSSIRGIFVKIADISIL